MTLLEQAQRLKDLTANVEAVADKERSARALDAVRSQVTTAKNAVVGYGVLPEYVRDVPEEALEEVQDRARALIDVLTPFEDADDAVLVAYGANEETATAGVLGSVGARARALGIVLRRSQREVLTVWAERVWPSADLARLEAVAAVEKGAKTALDLRKDLLAMDADDRMLSTEVLCRLSTSVVGAQEAAGDLRDKAPPSAVIGFYSLLEQSDGGVPLSQVGVEVLQWLAEHAGEDLVVQRFERA